MPNKSNKKETIKIYQETSEKYGDDFKAVHWGSQETQYFRFKILTEIANFYNDKHCIILDYGCGLGDLFFYLLFNGFRGKYIGVDILKSFIDSAKKKFQKYSQAKFYLVRSEKDIRKLKYDYCLISGAFNNKLKNNERLLKSIVKEAFQNSRQGAAFNAISTYTNYRDKNMAYFNPFAVAKFCLKELTPFFVLRHDYRRVNFTIYLYKNRGVSF